jgi:hypothetical protein
LELELVSNTTRLELYLVSGQVAITNLALTQGDAIFKTATKLISEESGNEAITPKFLTS